jgi:type III restriction enzyme
MSQTDTSQQEIPIQPVENPILSSPYEEPAEHWYYDPETGIPSKQTGRRTPHYFNESPSTDVAQQDLFAEYNRRELALVTRLRKDVRRWRKGGTYENATQVTRKLLRHWAREDLPRPLFFCQREAVETVIYLHEILGSGKTPRWNTALSLEDYERMRRGEEPSFAEELAGDVYPSLVDRPRDDGYPPLYRYACKMATGSGKTVIMSMLIAWALCNRGRVPGDKRFPSAVLICAPNLTVKERLQVLRPDHEDSYFDEFEIVPTSLKPELKKGEVLVTNWHAFLPESENKAFDGKTHRVVQKGQESEEAFARKRLGQLYDEGSLMVLNDEAHHAHRYSSDEESTVWIQGLDKINKACGIDLCVDLSATPFFLSGSEYGEGTPFPWIVSDFGLVDAIESGITKVPRLPIADDTGRPDPKYFRLWDRIKENLDEGDKLPSGAPKPEAVWRESEDALLTLATQWSQLFDQFEEASPGQDRVPPVMIVVCNNTATAKHFHEKISGERTEEVEEDGETVERTTYGKSQVDERLANTPEHQYTVRIDTEALEKAESEELSKGEAEEQLRRIVSTVGEPGKPGEHVRCVVSVEMLTEGWDASNVTQILGLRAFGTQLMCEQVAGRGLRRMDYTLNDEDRFDPEYVDIYGIPFSVIPFRGREGTAPQPQDKPKNHVHTVEERSEYEIRFPVVESYAFSLKENRLTVDFDALEELEITREEAPTTVFVEPQVGVKVGSQSRSGTFKFKPQDRSAFYENNHLQTVKFEITRQITDSLTQSTEYSDGSKPKMKHRARHQLFPKIYQVVDRYVAEKVNFRGCPPQELGLEKYTRRVVERLLAAIEPADSDTTGDEPPLLPVLNRHRKTGSTAAVDFKTTKPCHPVQYSHLNQYAFDTESWEQSAAFFLEKLADEGVIECHARNERMEFTIPYEFEGTSHAFVPDFLVRPEEKMTIIVEVKGRETEKDRQKYQAARRWVSAVNNWGELGEWDFLVCNDPPTLEQQLQMRF